MDANDLLPISQVAAETFEGCVTSHSVRRWVAKGVGHPRVKLPAVRLGCNYFVRRCDAEAYRQALSDPEVFAARQRSEQSERSKRAKKRLETAGA